MRSTEVTIKVDGMICPQCEDEISQDLLHRRGILNADSSYRKSTVTIIYDPDIIELDAIYSALEEIGYPKGNGKSGIKSDIIGALSIVVISLLAPWLIGLANTPVASQGASLTAILVIGAISGLHCIGMCGGIMYASVYGSNTSVVASLRKSIAVKVLSYNGSRLLSYTLVGLILGAIGKFITYDMQFKSMFLTICGLIIVIIGLMMWGVPFLRRISPHLTKPCKLNHAPAIVGLLTGIMPCGALSAMWLFAATSGSAVNGALSMFTFGIGTCFAMVAFGIFGVFIPKKYNKYLLKISTILIVSFGIILAFKGLSMVL